METVKVSSGGRIVIPKALRETLHLAAGAELAIFAEGDEIHLRPIVRHFPETTIAGGRGLLAKPGRRLPDEETLQGRIRAAAKGRDDESKGR